MNNFSADLLIINGELIMEERKLLSLDISKIAGKVVRIAKDISKKSTEAYKP